MVESFSLGLVRSHQVSQKPAQFLITEHRHTHTDNLPAVNTHLQQKKKRDEVTEKKKFSRIARLKRNDVDWRQVSLNIDTKYTHGHASFCNPHNAFQKNADPTKIILSETYVRNSLIEQPFFHLFLLLKAIFPSKCVFKYQTHNFIHFIDQGIHHEYCLRQNFVVISC